PQFVLQDSCAGRASRRLAGYLGDLARGKREGDGEPAKSDWEDLQAKSRTDAERMEALGRLLQEESVEDWRSLQLGAPRAAMPASDSVSSRDPRNLRDPSNARRPRNLKTFRDP
ncbi:unnamed protein product, partial [Effrenium voratum]